MNISANGTAHDVAAGKSAIVHRIGCDAASMLPPPDPLELVKGGDMEGVAGSGPGTLFSSCRVNQYLSMPHKTNTSLRMEYE